MIKKVDTLPYIDKLCNAVNAPLFRVPFQDIHCTVLPAKSDSDDMF